MTDKKNHIMVNVETTYLDHESDPARARYLFAYTITITNEGDTPARLLSRYWKITGGDGHEQEVEGDGVVGQHPYLAPTETFTYTSAAMLDSPVGKSCINNPAYKQFPIEPAAHIRPSIQIALSNFAFCKSLPPSLASRKLAKLKSLSDKLL